MSSYADPGTLTITLTGDELSFWKEHQHMHRGSAQQVKEEHW
jgi:hypothetical protein